MNNVLLFGFETVVNIYQSFLTVYFLTGCMEYKERYSKKYIYMIGMMIEFILLELALVFVAYEEFGSFIYFISFVVFSIIYLKGTFLEKIVYSVIFFSIIVACSFLGVSIVGMLYGKAYEHIVEHFDIARYISMAIVQVLLYIVAKTVVNIVHRKKVGKNIWSSVAVVIISLISAAILFFLNRIVVGKDEKYTFFYSLAMVICVIAIVLAAFIVYGISEKNYEINLRQGIELNALKRQEYDVEQINKNATEIEKISHEMNKVMMTLHGLLDSGEYEKAKSFTLQFQKEENKILRRKKFTENIVLNYLINDRLDICEKKGIDMTCLINGDIDGVNDVDIHCVFTNLVDNAIEAVENLDKKHIEVAVQGNDTTLVMEVCNNVKGNVLKDNPTFKTTKKQHKGHGYGILNVKNIVEKYGGNIEYCQKTEDIISCQVVFLKHSRQKMSIRATTIEK